MDEIGSEKIDLISEITNLESHICDSQDDNFTENSHESTSNSKNNELISVINDYNECLDGVNSSETLAESQLIDSDHIKPTCSIEDVCSEDKFSGDETNNCENTEIPSILNSKETRRSSLPENKINTVILENSLDNASVNGLKSSTVEFNGLNELTSSARVKKKQVELKSVVKNVHGLFSMVGGSLKNAYKPVEKNFGEMMSATQKNLSLVKNDYLKPDKHNLNNVMSQNLNKYSTLNLSNENDEIFKKCENFSSTDLKFTPKNNNSSESTLSGIDSKNFAPQIPDCENEYLSKSHRSVENFTIDYESNDSTKENDSIKSLPIELEKVDVQIPISRSSECLLNTNETDIELRKKLNDYGASNKECLQKSEILECAVQELHKEISVLKSALIDKDAIKKNLESRVNLLMKQLETITAERDASVVRYAVSERSILEATKSKELAVNAEQAARREVSMIGQRLKIANADKTRATAAFDMKCHELSTAQRETVRIKEEFQACELKLKWAQSKLLSEMDAHKETSALVEKLSFQIKQFESGNFSSLVQPTQSVDIESQLREKDAHIILERHEKEKFDARCKQLQVELDKMKNILSANSEEIRELKAQVEAGSAESAALRRTCAELREQGAKDCERLAIAQARAARCDTLTVHLQQEQERSAKLVQELESMKTLREEALAEGELKARREAELLRQAERLTAVGVRLQATCSEAEAKALALTVDNASLREAAAKAAAEVAEARLSLIKERDGRAADARALASRAAQHARGEREALNALEAARGEARVNATKHASAIKELKRELAQTKKRYEKLENEGRLLPQSQTQMSSDRTGSSSSLSSYDGVCQQNHITENSDVLKDIQINTPDRQNLVERIVSLQRAAARKGEKLDFLEEHNRQLTQELQKKTRLLRSFLVAAPTGSLSSPASDAVKVEIGKHGGVMASVYGSQVTDETMTLELSLEINAKLQNLLEDTLLSNITLKENMDTLGDEISRLKEVRNIKK